MRNAPDSLKRDYCTICCILCNIEEIVGFLPFSNQKAGS